MARHHPLVAGVTGPRVEDRRFSGHVEAGVEEDRRKGINDIFCRFGRVYEVARGVLDKESACVKFGS